MGRAGLSLYKALLKQSFALSDTLSGGIRTIIRHRFKTDRVLQSPTQIANGLKAGTEVLDLLFASAQGGSNATSTLGALLESTLKSLKSNEAYRTALRSSCGPTYHRRDLEPVKVGLGADKGPRPDRSTTKSILDRPLPLSEIRGGRRRVPRFIITQGIPFLRYSKPQPKSLGNVLRQKIARHTKRWAQRKKLGDETIPLGEDEDAWDALVALQQAKEGLKVEEFAAGDVRAGLNCDPESWTSVSRLADAQLAQSIRTEEKRNMETARRMVEIMKQERALAAQEKAHLESIKYERRVQRRADKLLASAAEDQRPTPGENQQ